MNNIGRSVSRGLRRAWKGYENQLKAYPLPTQIATSTGLWCTGDILSQRIEGKQVWDMRRTAWTGVYGGALIGDFPLSSLTLLYHARWTSESALDAGPLGHWWYQSLERMVASRLAKGTLAFILSKVVADEMVFGPIHVVGFFAWNTWAEGGSWEAIKAKISNDFWSAYLTELAVWPAFQTYNFWRVPVQHQLLVVNMASLIDSTFLCWVGQQEDWTRILRPYFSGSESSEPPPPDKNSNG